MPAFEIDVSETFPHLAAAPIAEAVIHWIAKPEKLFSAEQISGDLEKDLRKDFGSDYPHYTALRAILFAAKLEESGATQSQSNKWRGFKIESEDRLSVIQFLQDGFAFSRLQPYTSWETFSAEALRLWKLYRDRTNVAEIQRLGVRFINRITLRDIPDASRFLKQTPQILGSLELNPTGFLFVVEYDIPNQPLHVTIAQTTSPPAPNEDGPGLIVDIDVSTTNPFQADKMFENGYLEKMHWLKNKAFFTIITEEAVRLWSRK